jgi:hypothetical protein
MSHIFDPAWLLLIPFLAILSFALWALWSFSDELRQGRRRRVRRPIYGHQVKVYLPEPRQPVLRFSRRRDQEAA